MSAIGAVVPAAGRSRRMGRSKPLLPLGPSDYLGTIVGKLRQPALSIVAVAVVHRADDTALEARLGELAGPDLTPVAVAPGAGDMLHSVRAGAAALPGVEGVLVWPVDAPAIATRTLAAVVAAARSRPERIGLPHHGDQPGHPVYVPAVAFRRDDSDAPGAPGLRGLLESSGLSTQRIDVDDPGCLLNTNTPEEYRRLREEPRDP